MSTETASFLTPNTQQAVRELTETFRAPVYARLLAYFSHPCEAYSLY